VLGGIAVESLCTVFLFVFDESISAKQQSTIGLQNAQIISLETQIAARRLDKSQFDAFKSLKGKVPAVNIIPEAALEPGMFAGMLATALQSAGVEVKEYSASLGMMGTGITNAIAGFQPRLRADRTGPLTEVRLDR
jgi:hypothetical protein